MNEGSVSFPQMTQIYTDDIHEFNLRHLRNLRINCSF